MKNYIYIFVLFFGINPFSFGQFQAETFDQLGEKEGLSSGVVTCILKDSRGFMWFGTQNGLNRFEGYSFTTFVKNDTIQGSICGNFILDICEDEVGDLWICTENNGLCKYTREKDQFKKVVLDSTLAGDEEVNGKTLIKTSMNDILVGTNKGIYILDKQRGIFNKWVFSGNENPLNAESITEIYEDFDSTLWVGTEGGLFHINAASETARHFQYDPANVHTISNNTINCIVRATNDTLYIGTNEGLNTTDGRSGKFNRYYYNPNQVFSIEKSEIQAIVEDGRGNLWIGSFGGGLIKFDLFSKNKVAIYKNDPRNEESISNDYIYSLFFDPSGILWIGTYGGGINKVDQVKIRIDILQHNPSDNNSLAGNDVYAIHAMKNEVWIGTDQGVSILHSDGESFTQIKHIKAKKNSLSGNIIYAILEDRSGNIWIGAASEGLNKISMEDYEAGNYSFVHYTDGSDARHRISSNEIFCLFEDRDSTLWVGSSNGVDWIKHGMVVASFQHDQANSTSLSGNEIYSIYQDSKGGIWIGNSLGLNKFNPADSSFYYVENLVYHENSIDINTVYSIYEDISGNLWLGTDNSGLIKFDPNSEQVVALFTNENGLPDNVIYGILEDEENNLWLSSNNGIIKAIKQGTSDNLTFIRFNTSNGLKTDAYNIGAFDKAEDGTLYFGSSEGLTYFHPENVKGNRYVPPVYITGFQLFFKPVAISSDGSTPLRLPISETNKITLRHDQNVLKFNFTALNYIQPEKNKYAFRMAGLESEWNYVENQREAQYLYMPPGEYTFQVRASNNDGIWNETGASIDIIIKPPFTSTLWFYLIVIVGTGLIIIWIMQIRTRRLRATRDQLEKQVQKRTQELRSTNQNLQDEIMERKKVEEALKKSEARFRQLIETMNEGFSVQDKSGRINYVNPRLCQMFGMKQDEIMGKLPTDFVDDSSPVYLERFYQYRDEGIKTGIINSYEMSWKHKDGSVFSTMVSPKPIFNAEGQYQGSVAVLTDITELKKAETELLNKNEALNSALDDLKKTQAQLIDSEKMASLGQLTAGVAHEINNPINFVSGNVKPLQRDIEDILEVLHTYDKIIEAEKLENNFKAIQELKEKIDFEFVLSEINNLLDGIGEGAARTAEIVKGLRNFSRMDEHELKPANINQGLDSTLLILHNKLKQRIEIIKDYGDLPDIMCYPGQLNQVFLNILNNAQEAIEGEGSIYIKTCQEGNVVKISIKDTGKGIPEHVRKKIFDPFYTTKEIGKGTGLGLSISYGIIEKHNGKIDVVSIPEKGSEFIITLPIIEH